MPPARRRPGGKPQPNSPGVRIDLDGRTYVVREADLTSRDVRALRQETGFSFVGLVGAMEKDPDIDLIGALVWLARRKDGEQVSYDDVLDGLSYGSDLNVTAEDKRTAAKGEDDFPEA